MLEIPGHSSGHVVFCVCGRKPWVVFAGDVLFRGSVGRTDFPDGSFESLADGIHRKLFTLPDDTVILPGHGDPTTVGEERATIPSSVDRPAGEADGRGSEFAVARCLQCIALMHRVNL